jgi:hypothetical protein
MVRRLARVGGKRGGLRIYVVADRRRLTAATRRYPAGAGSPGATMASFLVWTAIVMTVFHARSATRAWAWLTAAAVPLSLIVWQLLPGARA